MDERVCDYFNIWPPCRVRNHTSGTSWPSGRKSFIVWSRRGHPSAAELGPVGMSGIREMEEDPCGGGTVPPLALAETRTGTFVPM